MGLASAAVFAMITLGDRVVRIFTSVLPSQRKSYRETRAASSYNVSDDDVDVEADDLYRSGRQKETAIGVRTCNESVPTHGTAQSSDEVEDGYAAEAEERIRMF